MSGARPQLLFLSQCLPFPPHSGVTNRTFNVLRQLQRTFDVRLVAFSRRNHQPTEAARADSRAALSDRLSAVAVPVPIPAERSRFARLLAHIRSVLAHRPYVFDEYASPAFAAEVASMTRGHAPDLVHADSLDLYGYFPQLGAVPIACTHHSVESELLRLRAAHFGSRIGAAYLGWQADRIEDLERAECGRLALNVMMSEIDADRLKRLVPSAQTYVAANGVDVELLTPASPERQQAGRVVFLGPTYMYPNRDGLGYFLDEVWPRIRLARPEATLHLVGRNSEEDRRRYAEVPGVVPRGFVDDIREPFAEAACSVVPLRIGGGTRLKILDSWSMGKAVVSTAVGCEGLAVRDGENILVRDDPASFADAVLAVLADQTLRQKLETGGRQTAVEQYSWDRVGAGLRGRYQKLIDGER